MTDTMADDADKHSSNKNGKKSDGPSGTSFFTWFMIIALLGVWSSVAVVWFDLVDYEDVLGKLGVYDADGDGDFDVEDAKILLGLKEVEGPVPAEKFGKNEEPIQPSMHTFVETEAEKEELELMHDSVDPETFKPTPEVAAEGEEPPTEERTNEFDAGDEDFEDVEADEVTYETVESGPEEAHTPDESEMVEEEMYEHAESPEESVYVEDETLSEGAEILEDSGPEVADVGEDNISESEVRGEEVDDYAVSDEAELEPEEVVSERDVPGVYESELEEDFSDQVDSEDEMEKELPISDEFIEENDVPEPEDTVEEIYAEEPEYVPGTEDIQEVYPVLQNTDEDSQSVAVPLPEAVEEPTEEEYVNYAEVSEPSEPDHLEVTEEEVGAAGLQEDTSDETVSPSEAKRTEMPADL